MALRQADCNRAAAFLVPLLLLAGGAAKPVAALAAPGPVVLDFSAAGQGPFDPDFFHKSAHVRFLDGSFVGYVQGDQALIGPVAWRVRPLRAGIVRVKLAPAIQGTARYTLAAWSAGGKPLASMDMDVTQDTGNPATGPFGYVTLLLDVPEPAASYTLTSTFLGSSFPHVHTIDFGVAEIGLPGH